MTSALHKNRKFKGFVLNFGGLPVKRVLEILAGPIALLLVWWISYKFKVLDAHLLPSPFATLVDMWKSVFDGSMLYDAWKTLERVLKAFVLAAILGIPAGLALGARKSIYRCSE